MTTIYDRGRALASRLLAKNGQKDADGVTAVWLIKTVSPVDSPDPAEPWNPGMRELGSPSRIPLDAAVRGRSSTAGERYYANGQLVLASNLVVKCAVPEVEPEMEDRIEIDGVEHAIMAIDPKPAAGPPVAYEITVRL